MVPLRSFVSDAPAKSDRFQMVQSPMMARLTFKLDSYTGEIWQLVVDKRGVPKWEPVPVLSFEKVAPASEP
jgi:hypothetical protein